jgi:hypothetical protein
MMQTPLPGGGSIEKVDFERHVMGLLGRMGCNNGSCHGSFQGKGGFQLSLFGYDPAKDYRALTRGARGRLVDLGDPDASLILLKATGQMTHGGQTRFGKRSWAYRLLQTWIAQGAKWKAGSGQVRSIEINPREFAFSRAGQSGQVNVTAVFADGSREDITALCDFRSNDDAVVDVTSLGKLKAVRAGDTAVVVSYRGNVVPVRVLVPADSPPGFQYPKTPTVNSYDRIVFAKLKRLNMAPSALCTDSEFLRRVMLDTVGILPTPDEIRAFLADKRLDKRARKIDELLSHPMHAALWATKFCDITGNNTDSLENPPQRKHQLSQMWHNWFRKRLAANMPYDEMVRGVLCATSRDGKTPEEYLQEVVKIEEACAKYEESSYPDKATLDLFWRKQGRVTNEQWGEKTAAAFLGVRLECAQCHKHPFDRWTQADYRSFANIFTQVQFGSSPDAAKLFKEENKTRNELNRERSKAAKNAKGKKGVKPPPPLAFIREVFIGPFGGKGSSNPLRDPDTNKVLPGRALGGPEIRQAKGEDPRVALLEWMCKPGNPFFARSFVNRVWGHYFGVGIVNPVDDFSLANPPSNSELLDALAQDFVRSNYDLRVLERAILNSRTYQLSSTPNKTNRLDRRNYARSYVRPMMAEVVVDSINAAIGVSEKWGPEVPRGARTIEIGASRVNNGAVAFAFRIFGRSPRTTACDCERAMEPGLPQKLYLMADPLLQNKIRAPGNRLASLVVDTNSDDQILDELFLATLSRMPTQGERQHFRDYLASVWVAPPAPPPAGKNKSQPSPSPGKGAKGKPGKVQPAPPAKVKGDKTKPGNDQPNPPQNVKGDKNKPDKGQKGQPIPPGKGKGKMTQRHAVFGEVLWALINTSEFIFNH